MPDKPKSNRRDFLIGRAAIDSIRKQSESMEIGAPSDLDEARWLDRQSNYLEQYSKNAMACEFELLFNLHQYPQSGAAAMEAFELIDRLEDQMTVYRDHSEVSQINLNAHGKDVVVEHRLFEVLLLASQLNQQTGGAFDITSGPLTKVWGFDQRDGELPAQTTIDEALKSVGSEMIRLETQNRSIRFTQPGLTINLGGIGKGHALDRVSELFGTKSIGDFVIHGGQSSVLARGSSELTTTTPAAAGEAPHHQGWSVGISHPTLPGVRLAEVFLRDQALATSGTGRQGFYHQGQRYGHIIDPRTGWPTSHFLSTTVISSSAATSDALATAFFVMKLEEVADYCDKHPEIAAILAGADPNSKNQIQLQTFNLSDDDWKREN
jgi:thiamine biosynthesis lipoprotein